MPRGAWLITCQVCGQHSVAGPPHGTTCFACEAQGYKYCSTCGRVLPVEQYYRRPDTGKYMTKCISCYTQHRNAVASVDRQNPEYIARRNEQSRQCKQRKYATATGRQEEIDRCHARRSLLHGSVSYEQWQQCLDYFEHSCAYCGTCGKLTVDHIIPISRFGVNRVYNVVPACSSCNSSKSAHDILDWFPKQSFFSQDRLLKIHAWFKDMQKEVV